MRTNHSDHPQWLLLSYTHTHRSALCWSSGTCFGNSLTSILIPFFHETFSRFVCVLFTLSNCGYLLCVLVSIFSVQYDVCVSAGVVDSGVLRNEGVEALFTDMFTWIPMGRRNYIKVASATPTPLMKPWMFHTVSYKPSLNRCLTWIEARRTPNKILNKEAWSQKKKLRSEV